MINSDQPSWGIGMGNANGKAGEMRGWNGMDQANWMAAGCVRSRWHISWRETLAIDQLDQMISLIRDDQLDQR
jgi:hypothetical protein